MMNPGETVYWLLLRVHAIAGLAALVVFWIPALTKKGSPVHRLLGKAFMAAMTLVVVTGVPLAARFLFEGQWVAATFLLYLAVITGTSVGTAWYAVKLKRDAGRYFGHRYRMIAVLNLASGGAVIALGWVHGVWLLFGFGFIGVLGGIEMLQKSRATDRVRNWWLLEHLGGMIGAGIAAHVAFGAFGLRRIWPAYASMDGWVGMLPWIAPVVIGVLAGALLGRKYRRGTVPPGAVV